MSNEKVLQEINQLMGKKIMLYRKAKCMTSQELANLLNITEEQLLRYESGIDRVLVNQLVKISKILDIDISYLLLE